MTATTPPVERILERALERANEAAQASAAEIARLEKALETTRMMLRAVLQRKRMWINKARTAEAESARWREALERIAEGLTDVRAPHRFRAAYNLAQAALVGGSKQEVVDRG